MPSIEFFQIYGERNSGTNYLDKILRSAVSLDANRVLGSTPKSKNPHGHVFGFKHWFVDDQCLQQTSAENTLFVVVFRHPLFWIRSMIQRPYQAQRHVGLEPGEFIRRQWYAEENGKEMMIERDPLSGDRFSNIMALRVAKNQHFLALEDRVENFMLTRYEDLLSDPCSLLQAIADKYPGLLKPDYRIRRGFRTRYRQYIKTRKQQKEIRSFFSSSDLAFIKQNLDLAQERHLGYEL